MGKELIRQDAGKVCQHLFIPGGEECDTAEAAIVAERIRQAVASHTVITGNEKIHFTVSLGVAGICEDCDLNRMLERADHALYEAKENGRNQTRTFNTKNVQHA